MTPIEQRAYGRGYYQGSKKGWPPHRPPTPPDELLARFFLAARALRDAVDAACATFGEDDEFVRTIDPKIEAFDKEMEVWTEWLTNDEARIAATSAAQETGRGG